MQKGSENHWLLSLHAEIWFGSFSLKLFAVSSMKRIVSSQNPKNHVLSCFIKLSLINTFEDFIISALFHNRKCHSTMHIFKCRYIIVNDSFSFLNFSIVVVSQTLMVNIMNTCSEISSELFKICHLTFLFDFACSNVVDHGLCDIA